MWELLAGIEVEMDWLSKLTKDELNDWLRMRNVPQDVVKDFEGNYCTKCLFVDVCDFYCAVDLDKAYPYP